jgi:hypothetical protein
LLIFGLLLPSVALADITGTVTVVDGDTLEIRGTSYGSRASTLRRAVSFASGAARITGAASRPPRRMI